MVRIIWTREAAAGLEAAFDYVQGFKPLAAQRLAVRLVQAGESLAQYPLRGRLRRKGERELVIVPPYVLRYRVEDDKVLILDVRHGARRR